MTSRSEGVVFMNDKTREKVEGIFDNAIRSLGSGGFGKLNTQEERKLQKIVGEIKGEVLAL